MWREGAGLGLPPARYILGKKSFKGMYPFGENSYQKLTILAPVSPHFPSYNREVWSEGTDLGHPRPCLIL